jgi:Fungal protein kinase
MKPCHGMQADMLLELAKVPGLVRLVHSNTTACQSQQQLVQAHSTPIEPPFLVTTPFGRCLELDDSAEVILKAIACAARTVGCLAQLTPPVLHRDVSLGNLIIVPEEISGALMEGSISGAYLLDLATARRAPGGQVSSSSIRELTGTPLFMACSILEGKPHTVSSDLESLLLLLIYLGCNGHVHWANTLVGSRGALSCKVHALTPGECFEKYVRKRCRPDLLPAVDRLHALFFFSVYNQQVTVAHFQSALSGA